MKSKEHPGNAANEWGLYSSPPDTPLIGDISEAFSRIGKSWELLRGESIFITGGTGFFGRWLLEVLVHANRLLDLNLKLAVLTRNVDAFSARVLHLAFNPAIRFYQGDVSTFDFPAGSFSHVIHAAATSAQETFLGHDPLRKYDTLVHGTRRVLEFSTICGARRFLFTSSGVVYGTGSVALTAIAEDFPEAPATLDIDSALGHGKRSAEFLCACYAQRHGWDLTIARCFSFVGPFLPLDLHYAIGNFIQQARMEREIVVKGDGTPLRSYLYVADLVTWLLTLLLRAPAGHIYNVGSDAAISIKDLAHLVRDIVSPGKPVRILSKPPYSVGNPSRNCYVPDIAKARVDLGLDVWTPLAEAISRTDRIAFSQT